MINESLRPTAAHVGITWTRRAGPALLMAASGFAGLGYQIVWTQQLALLLGHDSAAVLAVVTAFFAGVALGARALGARIESSANPVRWYAACEILIGAWALLLSCILTPVSSLVLHAIGPQPSPAWQWTTAFAATFVLLLPATAAMGATLPAMARITAHWSRAGRSIGVLYASNTAGALVGVLAMAFWLAPRFGLKASVAVAASLNLVCALGSMLLLKNASGPHVAARVADPTGMRGLIPRLALTGLLGIGYEVLVVRVLSEVAEDTVYTFALLLAAYLAGSAAGAALYHRCLRSRADEAALPDRLLFALALACIAGSASLWAAESIRNAMQSWLGGGMPAAIAAEGVLALSAFALPTAVMGALFSHLSDAAMGQNIDLGRAVAANTAGAAVAPILFGVLLLPAIGAKYSLLLVGAGYAALICWRRDNAALLVTPLLAAAAVAVAAPPLVFIDVPEGGRILSFQEGPMAAVSVVEDAQGVARLRINNRQQEGSNASLRVDGRQALLPLLLHPRPRNALFLGLGTGVTAFTAAQDPALQVDAVELLPEVITASAEFRTPAATTQPPAGNIRVMAADARRFVRTSPQRYDVIIADNFHPARSGSGALYSVEHFAAVRARLSDSGIFCQWLPLHQLDLQTLRSIVRSFIDVYPEAEALLASNSLQTPVLGLLAHRQRARVDPAQLRERLAGAGVYALPDFGLDDEYAVMGAFVAGPAALRRFAAGAPANTDDFPVVAYQAPRITYAPDSTPGERLSALLDQWWIAPSDLITDTDPAHDAARLAAYWSARTRFISIGQDVHPSADVHEMLRQVREPLLSVLRVSPDFRPAYDPLLMMAAQLSHSDATAARQLLTELNEAQPQRNEAARALQSLR